MSLADFAAARRAAKVPRCTVCQLPAAVREDIVRELAQPPQARPTYKDVSDYLHTIGHAVPVYSVRDHLSVGHERRFGR